MDQEKKKMLVPKWRFPEFREAGAWEETTLGDVTYKAGKKNKKGDKLPIYSINNKEGFLPQADQFEGMDSNSRGYDTTLYKVIENKTFAYNPARIDVGSIGYSGDLNDVIISSLYVCFKTKENLDDIFLLCFLKTNHFNESVKNKVEGGIRNYLFYENFASINIYLPTLPEQQKIATLLTTLDHLIAAQNEKISALQRHKKGLMQQLFPAEGERVPRVRFEGFEGEWDSLNGDWVFDQISNKDHNSNLPILAITQEHGAIPRDKIDYNVIVTEKSVEGYKVVEIGDFIISLRSFQGGIEYSIYKGICSPAYIILRKKIDIEDIFFKFS